MSNIYIIIFIMKDKIISKNIYKNFYDKYYIDEYIINTIFIEYLKNENLNVIEKKIFIKNKFETTLQNICNIDNIFESKVYDFDYDPHKFNAYGFCIKKNIDNIDNIFDSLSFSIKSKNKVSKYSDIIDYNIESYNIELILWFKYNNISNEDIDIYKNMFVDLNNLSSCTFHQFTIFKHNYLRLTLKLSYKFDNTNIIWKKLKPIFDFNESLYKDNYSYIIYLLKEYFIHNILKNMTLI